MSIESAGAECSGRRLALNAMSGEEARAAVARLMEELTTEAEGFQGTSQEMAAAAEQQRLREQEQRARAREAELRAEAERAAASERAALQARVDEQQRLAEELRRQMEEAERQRKRKEVAGRWKGAMTKVLKTDQGGVLMRERGIRKNKPFNQYAPSTIRDQAPFTIEQAERMALFLQALFSGREALALFGGIERFRTNVNISIDDFGVAYNRYSTALAAQKEADKQRAELVGKIFAGALSAALGPLGGLAGNALAAAVGALVEHADRLAVLIAQAKELATKNADKLAAAVEKGKAAILEKVQAQATARYGAKLDKTRPSASIEDAAGMKAALHKEFEAFCDTLVRTVLEAAVEITGGSSALTEAYLETPGALSEDLRREQFKKAVDYLWAVHTNPDLDPSYFNDLYRRATDYVSRVYRDSQQAIVGQFVLNEIPRLEGELLKKQSERVQRQFELRIWAHHLLGTFKDQPIALRDKIFARLVDLEIVEAYSRSSTNQSRAYSAGRIRYGTTHASMNESVRMRLLLEYIDTHVDPLKAALGRAKAEEVEEGIHQYARDIEDAIKDLKDASALKSDEERVRHDAVLAKVNEIRAKRAPDSIRTATKWVADKDANKCHACREAFSLLKRRHHCRACGEVFCDACTSKRRHLRSSYLGGEARVCDDCAAKIPKVAAAS